MWSVDRERYVTVKLACCVYVHLVNEPDVILVSNPLYNTKYTGERGS